MKVPIRLRIGPLQLAIHVVQNCHAGEQQKAYIILNGNFLCLSCPRATFALQYSGFVPREWQRAYSLTFPGLGIVKMSELGESVTRGRKGDFFESRVPSRLRVVPHFPKRW